MGGYLPQIPVVELRGGIQTDCLIFARTFGQRKWDVLVCKSRIGMRGLNLEKSSEVVICSNIVKYKNIQKNPNKIAVERVKSCFDEESEVRLHTSM